MANDVRRQATQFAMNVALPGAWHQMDGLCLLARKDLTAEFPQGPLEVKDGWVTCQLRIANTSGGPKAFVLRSQSSRTQILTTRGISGWKLHFEARCEWPSRKHLGKLLCLEAGESETVTLSAQVGKTPPESVVIRIVAYDADDAVRGKELAAKNIRVRAEAADATTAPVGR
jgi:hypothetical protein